MEGSEKGSRIQIHFRLSGSNWDLDPFLRGRFDRDLDQIKNDFLKNWQLLLYNSNTYHILYLFLQLSYRQLALIMVVHRAKSARHVLQKSTVHIPVSRQRGAGCISF